MMSNLQGEGGAEEAADGLTVFVALTNAKKCPNDEAPMRAVSVWEEEEEERSFINRP